ncbi:nucleoside/nucleotide kinase family protein [Jiangella rhizosphaerae]|uniref:Uridine kinase n=1 Tax=Jiangella rhizosphaerae TaxID=2293569 RepID=A0A418KGG0_9ACTN|nr:uridine kinase [Jiangella rhizosphaerae]RIQ11098.1 uridine kinase [Jiangella rhizosphaerae]
MRVQPVTEDVLVTRIVDLVLATAAGSEGDGGAGGGDGRGVRMVVDGHPAAHPERLADALVDPLRAAGRPVARIRVRDFLRPRSLRLEHGPHDPDSLLDAWIDVAALNREVLMPVGPGGSGRYLPTLRDPDTDRSTRAAYVDAPPGLVVVLDGSLTLGRWLDLDLAVHLALRPATLRRLTPPADAWTLPAYKRYAAEVDPEAVADLVVRADDPRHPALVVA